MKYLLLSLLLILSVSVKAQTANPVTNQTILDLHKAGLGKEVLLSKIQTSTCAFDLSTEALIKLKNEKVPDEVISAMMTKVATADKQNGGGVSLAPGIYYKDPNTSEYIELDPSILTNQKSGGFGIALTRSISGLFNSKNKASLSGAHANTRMPNTNPTFTFIFDTSTNSFSNNSSVWGGVQSPNEFFLVKMKVEKNSREIVTGKGNNVKEEIGIDDDAKVKFSTKKLRKGVYEVSPEKALKTGEYCFMFAASSMYQGTTHKVYDFSIK